MLMFFSIDISIYSIQLYPQKSLQSYRDLLQRVYVSLSKEVVRS